MDEIIGKSFSGDNAELLLKNRLGLDLSQTEYAVKTYSDGIKYLCLYSEGLSIGINSKTDIVDCVDLYKSGTALYQPLKNRSLIPENIAYDAKLKELVELYGEPIEKGGGSSSEPIDIWLRWPGIEISVKCKNWDQAKDLSWSMLTLYEIKK